MLLVHQEEWHCSFTGVASKSCHYNYTNFRCCALRTKCRLLFAQQFMHISNIFRIRRQQTAIFSWSLHVFKVPDALAGSGIHPQHLPVTQMAQFDEGQRRHDGIVQGIVSFTLGQIQVFH